MRALRIATASVVLLLGPIFLSGTSASSNIEQHPSSPDETAIRKTLSWLYERYKQYLAEKNEKRAEMLAERVKGLGFETVQELPSIVIGPGFPVFVVQLDELRKYQKGTDAWHLLHETRFTLYPVMVPDKNNDLQVRSAARVGQNAKGKDPIGEWGHFFFAQPLTIFRDELQKAKQCLGPSRCFVIEIPALGEYLFGVRDDNAKTLLVARLDLNSKHLTSKELREAGQVFQELSIEASNPGYDLDRHDKPTEKRQLLPNDAVRLGS